jgi:hypothetical protein
LDADTRDLLRESIQGLFACGTGDVVNGLDELGWRDVVSDDPAASVDLFFTEQGRAGRSSAYLDNVLLDAAGGDLDQSLSVIHPIGAAACMDCDELLSVDGVALTDPRTTPDCVVALDGAETAAYLLPQERLDNATSPVAGFDRESSLYRVRLDVSFAEVQERKCDWIGAVAAARRALAAELVGNASAMMDIAVDHVVQRTQFGRPIGANQSPRHRLAECYSRIAGARALVDAAWRSGTSWDAWVAKTYAGSASEATSRTCMQVCGAMGLTSEHSLGGYVKRARILDALYGGWRDSVQDIGMTLLRDERIPVGPRL